MEILMLLVVLALVVFVVVNQQPQNYFNGRIAAAQIFTGQEISPTLLQYKTDTGSHPTTTQGLTALISAPPGVSHWRGPYIKITAIPLDPWKNSYHYAFPSTHGRPAGNFDCWSNGPDGINGTADDIGNWK